MKTARFLLLASVFLVAALAAALVFVARNVDPNDYKQEIQAFVERETGRKLHIEGDVRLTLFPTLSLEVERVGLDNPAGFEGRFLSVEHVRAGLELLPLLQRRIEVGRVVLRRPRVALRTLGDGRANWEGLGVGGARAEPGAGDRGAFPASVMLAGVTVEDASVSWRDERAGEHLVADAVAFETGAFTFGEPVAVRLGGVAGDRRRGLSAGFALDATVSIDPASRRAALDGLELAVDWRRNDAPPVPITASAGLAIDFGKGTGAFSDLVIAVGDARVEGSGSVSGLFSDAPGVAASVATNEFDFRALAGMLGAALPKTADDTALRKFSAAGDFVVNPDGRKGGVTIRRAELGIDDTRLSARGEAAWLPAPGAALTGTLDRVDLGRYLPADNAVPGAVRVENLRARVRAEDGRVDVSALTMQVFGGHFDGAFSYAGGSDARPSAWRGRGRLDGARFERLLDAFGVGDGNLLKGTAALDYELSAAGDDGRALKGSLAGSGGLTLEEGSFRDPKLARAVDRIIAFLEKRPSRNAGDELIFNKAAASSWSSGASSATTTSTLTCRCCICAAPGKRTSSVPAWITGCRRDCSGRSPASVATCQSGSPAHWTTRRTRSISNGSSAARSSAGCSAKRKRQKKASRKKSRRSSRRASGTSSVTSSGTGCPGCLFSRCLFRDGGPRGGAPR